MLKRALHALPAAALAIVFGWAAWERFRLPMSPTADPDLWVYLTPGLSALMGRGFTHVYGQCSLYPGFLYMLLRIGGDFRWITVVQSCLGLGTGALLYACWLRLRSLLVAAPLPTVVYKLLGTALAGVYLVSTASISFERALRPEAIFPFSVLLHVYCSLRFIHFRFGEPRGRQAVVSGSLAVFFSVVAFLLKPSFMGSLILGNLPVVISLFRPGATPREKWTLIALPAVAAAVLLLGPEWKLRQNDEMGSLFVARSLFSVHADFINDQLARDLAAGEHGRYPSDFLAGAHASLTQALRESRIGTGVYWPTLGFNPDYIVYGDERHPPFAAWVDDHLPDDEARTAFYRYYYRRAVSHQPAKMAAKAFRQLAAFYRFGECPAYSLDDRLSLANDYQLTATVLEAGREMRHYGPRQALTQNVAALLNTRDESGPFPLTQWAAHLLARWYFPLLLGAFALAAGTWWNPALRREYGAALATVCLLYAYNFGTVATLAVTHSLDVGRYSRYQLAYTILPEGVSAWLLAQVLLTAVAARSRRLRQTVYTRWTSRTQFREASAALGQFSWQGSSPRIETVVFTDVRAPSQRADGTADAWLVVSGSERLPIDQLRAREQVFADTRADLLVPRDEGPRSLVAVISAWSLWFVFGWSPRNPLSPPCLCSRRLVPYRPATPPDGPTRWALATLIRALAGGFAVLEIAGPASASSPVESGPRNPISSGKIAANGSLLGFLVARCFRRRPWVTSLGAVGVALCLLGLAESGSSWRQSCKRGHHYKITKVLASPVLLITGLLTFHVGLLLGAAQGSTQGLWRSDSP